MTGTCGQLPGLEMGRADITPISELRPGQTLWEEVVRDGTLPWPPPLLLTCSLGSTSLLSHLIQSSPQDLLQGNPG